MTTPPPSFEQRRVKAIARELCRLEDADPDDRRNGYVQGTDYPLWYTFTAEAQKIIAADPATERLRELEAENARLRTALTICAASPWLDTAKIAQEALAQEPKS